ncbi:cytidine deaminase-like protein [Lentinus tigrinus ALCF2SS1-7]|uniref:Cytidine deaminase-like protein n=1 Tax=Lentinus tigrinus ALCF2SS1-6 TaxID=1328759 RepID=A0A5C2SFR5_9APHY|nr:cytidine deaminase-like protein [Lentinus tigrinus ALCF2SS1-6]RPD74539.1 cytidine deaminase-like protein [Lentinus tigrinus ALCF2SS1-7]
MQHPIHPAGVRGLLLLLLLAVVYVCAQNTLQDAIAGSTLSINNIPFSTRMFWMRRANTALAELVSPCPVGAFASVVVNHTAPGLGELVCLGVNSRKQTGNPTLHGEMAAIQNCTKIMTDPEGPFKFSPDQTEAAFAQLSLYTNAESCPMCASAIRFTGFREYIYGSSIQSLVEQGWSQIRVPSIEIFRQSFDLPTQARLLGGVLTNETDPLFAWQFNPDGPCPTGCARANGTCHPLD